MVLHKHVAYLEDKKISQQLRSVFTSEQLPPSTVSSTPVAADTAQSSEKLHGFFANEGPAETTVTSLQDLKKQVLSKFKEGFKTQELNTVDELENHIEGLNEDEEEEQVFNFLINCFKKIAISLSDEELAPTIEWVYTLFDNCTEFILNSYEELPKESNDDSENTSERLFKFIDQLPQDQKGVMRFSLSVEINKELNELTTHLNNENIKFKNVRESLSYDLFSNYSTQVKKEYEDLKSRYESKYKDFLTTLERKNPENYNIISTLISLSYPKNKFFIEEFFEEESQESGNALIERELIKLVVALNSEQVTTENRDEALTLLGQLIDQKIFKPSWHLINDLISDKNTAVIEWLIKNNKMFTFEGIKLVMDNNRDDVFQLLVDNGININQETTIDGKKITLHLCAYRSNNSCIKFYSGYTDMAKAFQLSRLVHIFDIPGETILVDEQNGAEALLNKHFQSFIESGQFSEDQQQHLNDTLSSFQNSSAIEPEKFICIGDLKKKIEAALKSPGVYRCGFSTITHYFECVFKMIDENLHVTFIDRGAPFWPQKKDMIVDKISQNKDKILENIESYNKEQILFFKEQMLLLKKIGNALTDRGQAITEEDLKAFNDLEDKSTFTKKDFKLNLLKTYKVTDLEQLINAFKIIKFSDKQETVGEQINPYLEEVDSVEIDNLELKPFKTGICSHANKKTGLRVLLHWAFKDSKQAEKIYKAFTSYYRKKVAEEDWPFETASEAKEYFAESKDLFFRSRCNNQQQFESLEAIDKKIKKKTASSLSAN